MAERVLRSKLLTSEDYWAIWLGSFFLLFGIIIYLVIGRNEIGDEINDVNMKLKVQSEYPYRTVEWYLVNEKTKELTGSNAKSGKRIRSLLGKPKSWKNHPVKSFYSPVQCSSEIDLLAIASMENEVKRLETLALKAEESAKKSHSHNDSINQMVSEKTETWYLKKTELEDLQTKASDSNYNVLPQMVMLGALFAALFGIGAFFMGYKFLPFVLAFLGVFILGILAYFLAAQTDMQNIGISYAVWAILIGLIISNTIGTPVCMQPAVQTEYYIKTGLVLLGAEILLGKIMAIGLPGIFVSWVVTPIVLVTTYWFGQKLLKIGSKTLNITISADMSVCGVSAAIATAAACNAKKEELTLAVGLSMVFTSIMMVLMPAFINLMGIPEILGGAWIGGTIDATGAVVAAGAFLGDKALNVAATIKMIQNILIGLIAFAVAIYWATKVDNCGNTRVGISEIWHRFPKFIIGFLGASVVFSIIHSLLSPQFSYAFIDHGIIRGFTKDLRGWLFCLAFVSIGLSVNFKELKHHFSGGKPLVLYVCGQSFNLLLTLLMAYLMFYIVFPEITELI